MEELVRTYAERICHRTIEEMKRRLDQLLPPTIEYRSVVREVRLIYDAARHPRGFKWSVILVGLTVLEGDVRATSLRKKLGLNRSTIHRALRRLRDVGFVKRRDGIWVLNESTCPILYWLARRSVIIVAGKKAAGHV